MKYVCFFIKFSLIIKAIKADDNVDTLCIEIVLGDIVTCSGTWVA